MHNAMQGKQWLRGAWILFLLLSLWPRPLWGQPRTFRGVPVGQEPSQVVATGSALQEQRAQQATIMPGSYMTANCLPPVPVSSTTLPALACTGVVYTGGMSVPVTQAAAPIGPLSGGDGTYWLALHSDTAAAVGGWTRQLGTYYLWQKDPTVVPTGGRIVAPPVAGGAVLARITMAGGIITAVEDWRAPASLVRSGVFDVTDPLYGGVADDTTDIGPAIQLAVNAASAQLKRVVHIPQGTYALKSAVSINYGILLEGDGWGPHVWTHGSGTWLHVSQTTFTPIAIKASGTTVKDLAFDHDQPTPAPGWAPNPYPAAIVITPALGVPISDITVENIYLFKATRGIAAPITDDLNTGRLYIRNIWGQVFTVGIEIAYSLDISRIENVHFWPFWSYDTSVQLYMANNFITMALARCDGCWVTNFFSFNSHTGILFENSPKGTVQGFQGINISLDGVVIAVENASETGGNGFFLNLFANAATTGGVPNPGYEHSLGIFFTGGGHNFNFINVQFGNFGDNCVSLTNSIPSSSLLNITNFRCINYNLSGTNVPAVNTLNQSVIEMHGEQTLVSVNPTTKYAGAFVSPANPGGVYFDKDSTFFAAVSVDSPTVFFRVSTSDYVQFAPSINSFRLWSGAGTYNTGGVKQYLCVQDGFLTVGTTCP